MEPVDLGQFVLERGNVFVLPFLCETDVDGNTVELSSYGTTFAAKARLHNTSQDPISFTLDVSNIAGTVDADPTVYRLVLTLTGDQTKMMAGQLYDCDLLVTGGTLSPITLYKWQLQVQQTVTEAP